MNDALEDTEISLMLDIAHEAIRNRAARDDTYDAETYDAEHDPEGYITSLLTALRHWCHRHGIDWECELIVSEDIFNQDCDQAGQNITKQTRPNVSKLCCPECGRNEGFFIDASQTLLMFPDGTEIEDDEGLMWGDWSFCRCHACQHVGTVYQFRKAGENKDAIQ